MTCTRRLTVTGPKVRRGIVPLMFVVFLLKGGRADAADPDARSVEQIATSILQPFKQMPEDVAHDYRALFAHLEPVRLAQLRFHASSSLALKAAWRLAEMEAKTDDQSGSPDRGRLQRFLGFLEGRAHAQPPGWWEASLLDGSYDGTVLRPAIADENGNDDEAGGTVTLDGRDVFIPHAGGLSVDGDSVILRSDDAQRQFPTKLIHENQPELLDWATWLLAHQRTYVALGSSIDGAFVLLCVNVQGELLWRTDGWGTAMLMGGGTGLWHSRVELVLADQKIALFGQASGALFVEGFEGASGTPMYRFCTQYWAERGE